tara:strand:+ start:129 stop:479 length:351 start_codon:yes stop_codon:yes gene_type:complete
MGVITVIVSHVKEGSMLEGGAAAPPVTNRYVRSVQMAVIRKALVVPRKPTAVGKPAKGMMIMCASLVTLGIIVKMVQVEYVRWENIHPATTRYARIARRGNIPYHRAWINVIHVTK